MALLFTLFLSVVFFNGHVVFASSDVPFSLQALKEAANDGHFIAPSNQDFIDFR